jgi:hypothetical protein
MKDEINLLPPSLQRVRLRRLYLKRSGKIFRRLDIALGLILTMFIAVYFLLQSTHANLTEQLTVSDTATTIPNDIRATNELLTLINDRIKNTEALTPLIYDCLTTMPAGVVLSVVRVDEATGALILEGTFTSREDISIFQRRLEELPWVEAVDAPLKNFATGSQTSFSLTLTRKKPAV